MTAITPDAAHLDPGDELAFGPEWAVLESVCVGRAEADPEDIARLTATPGFRWGELLEQAVRHQVLPMVADQVLAASVEPGAPIPDPIRRHLQQALDVNRWNLTVHGREAAAVAARLHDAGIVFVATKGITFEPTIYGGRGTRGIKDVDFMAAPADREAVAAALRDLGYQPGVYDRRAGSIVPHPRRRQMVYAMSPDHLPSHARLTGDAVVPSVSVDVANSLTWTSAPYEVPMRAALAERITVPLAHIDHATVPAFTPPYQFLFTVLHLFREAWFDQWLELQMDVTLMKFGDVLRLFRAYRSQLTDGSLERTLDRDGTTAPVAWVLEHADRTFGTRMVEALGLQDRVPEDELSAAQPNAGAPRRWRGSMRERLWTRDRRALFADGEA